MSGTSLTYRNIKIRALPYIASVLFAIILCGSVDKKNISIYHFEEGDYVSALELQSALNIESSYNMIFKRGMFYFNNHVAVYTVDLSIVLIDGILLRFNRNVITKNGAMYLPSDMALSIIKMFFKDISVERTDRTINLELKKLDGTSEPLVKQPVYRPVNDRISFIVIDAGHGGMDPGAISMGGRLYEKNITLQISKYLEKSLKMQSKGIKILLTRKNDTFLELSSRTEIANRHLNESGNGIFLSIHVNASLANRISGYETYFLSQNPTNEDARNTAALENNVIVLEEKSSNSKKNYDDADYIEAMMLTTQIQKESSMLANSVQSGISKKIRDFKSRGVRKADFYVLRGVLMPAVLVEVGFITNQKESRYLNRAAYQKKIADGIAGGVLTFIKKYNNMLKKNK